MGVGTCMTAERGQSSLVKIHGKPGNGYGLGGGGALVSQTPREGLQQVKETEGPNGAASLSCLGLVLDTPHGHRDMPQKTSHRCPVLLSSVQKSKKARDGLLG